MADLDPSIGEPCPNCGSKSTYCIFDADQQSSVWSCETCHTVWDDGIAPDRALAQLIAKLPDDYDPDFPHPLIFGPEPRPDPNWDYFGEWECTIAIQRELAKILETMDDDDAENRCERVDRAMLDNARQIIAQAEKLKVLIGTALLNADKS